MNLIASFHIRPLHALAGAVLAASWVGISACSSEAAVPAPAHPVLVMTVSSTAPGAVVERSMPGVISARYAADLGFQVAGRIAKRLVEVGQSVRKGQVLLQLDSSDYELAASAAQDQVLAAKAQFEQAQSDAQRMNSLVADGAVSVADNERQKARADAARAQYQQARRQADLAGNRRRYASLIAPYDGVITGIRAEAGQVVSEGMPVLSIARPGEVEVVADIPEALIADVSHQQAHAEVWGTTLQRYDLRLRELSPAATQPLRTYRARFALQKASAEAMSALRLGMTAQVLLSGGGAVQATSAVTVPATALVKARDQVSVWLVNDKEQRLLLQPVKVLSYQNDSASVTGVPAGAKVVITGIQKLDASLRVRAVERTGAGLDAGARS